MSPLSVLPDTVSGMDIFTAPGQYDYAVPSTAITDEQVAEMTALVEHIKVDLRLGRPVSRNYYNTWSDSKPLSIRVNGRYYPHNALWSPEAIDLLLAGKASGALTKEHVVPYRVQLDYLLSAIEQGRNIMDMTTLMVLFPNAVIDGVADKLLNNAGLRQRMPDGIDWTTHPHRGFVRYSSVGIDISALRSIADWETISGLKLSR